MFLRPVQLLLTHSWGRFCFSIGALPAVPTHIPFSCSAMSFGFSARGALTLFTLNFIKLFFILQLLLSLKLAEHRIRERAKTFYLTLQLSCAWLCSAYAKCFASSSPFSFLSAFLPWEVFRLHLLISCLLFVVTCCLLASCCPFVNSTWIYYSSAL